MDDKEPDILHLARDKQMIDEYFRLMVKNELNLDMNFSNEYLITKNIVSKKLILVKTFSDTIPINSPLYFLLNSLFHKINNSILKRAEMMEALKAFKEH
ncbi:hypothetical protein [Chryseobacterium sp. Mn2064]|uniref:hypothetical protein n=1 Tax=Chryseobacterium sp. Mn2064 TaxID=3395263 RepID=UPI003BEEA037